VINHGYKPSPELIEDLRIHLSERMAEYNVPDRWKFVDKIPITGSGKKLRKKVKKIETELYDMFHSRTR